MEALGEIVRFLEPRFLWLLAGLPAFIILSFAVIKLKKIRLLPSRAFSEQFSAAKSDLLKYHLKEFLIWSCIFTIGVLLMSGLEYRIWTKHFFKEDVAICWAIDVSASMLAEEGRFGSGGRIAASKKEIREFLSPPFPPGIPMCLVIFAGDVYPVQDPNPDYNVFLQKLDSVRPDFFENQGTNFELAIKSAVDMLPESAKIKRLILLSDGDKRESAETDIASAISYAREKAVTIDAIGAGFGEAPIPNPRGIGFMKDENENPKFTELDEKTLRDEIAEPTGGIYRHYKSSGELKAHLSEIFENIKAKATHPVLTWAEADLPLGILGIFFLVLFLKLSLGIRLKIFGLKL